MVFCRISVSLLIDFSLEQNIRGKYYKVPCAHENYVYICIQYVLNATTACLYPHSIMRFFPDFIIIKLFTCYSFYSRSRHFNYLCIVENSN